MSSTVTEPLEPDWQKLIAPYAHPILRMSIWQVVNTLVPYAVLWALMMWTVRISVWLTLPLALLAAAFMMRAFIIFHDCCHGSFFRSRNANQVLGRILGVLTFTPFQWWRRDHNLHHATAGNLDKRGLGDVPTMTVREYEAASTRARLEYRITRTPAVLFTLGAAFSFVVLYRIWRPHAERRDRLSVIFTNVALLAIFLTMGTLFGFREYITALLMMIIPAAAAGVWMFYVQHQFPGVYWERDGQWSFVRAGMEGSSYYKLPAIANWFTGNIGYHHIHHLNPRVPNYLLPRCFDENPALQIKPITFRESLRCASLNLYDEDTRQMVSFAAART